MSVGNTWTMWLCCLGSMHLLYRDVSIMLWVMYTCMGYCRMQWLMMLCMWTLLGKSRICWILPRRVYKDVMQETYLDITVIGMTVNFLLLSKILRTNVSWPGMIIWYFNWEEGRLSWINHVQCCENSQYLEFCLISNTASFIFWFCLLGHTWEDYHIEGHCQSLRRHER